LIDPISSVTEKYKNTKRRRRRRRRATRGSVESEVGKQAHHAKMTNYLKLKFSSLPLRLCIDPDFRTQQERGERGRESGRGVEEESQETSLLYELSHIEVN
jgi:hypothetical protein